MKKMVAYLFAVMMIGAIIAGCSGKVKDTTEGGKYTFSALCAKVTEHAELGAKEGADKMMKDANMTQEQKDMMAKSVEFTPEMKAEIQKGCDETKKKITDQIPDEKKQKIAEGVFVKSLMESCKDKKGMDYMACLKTSEAVAVEVTNKAIR